MIGTSTRPDRPSMDSVDRSRIDLLERHNEYHKEMIRNNEAQLKKERQSPVEINQVLLGHHEQPAPGGVSLNYVNTSEAIREYGHLMVRPMSNRTLQEYCKSGKLRAHGRYASGWLIHRDVFKKFLSDNGFLEKPLDSAPVKLSGEIDQE